MIGRLAQGTVVDGRYVVETELGAGGMAVVYRVRHRTLGTPAALKLLSLSHPSIRARLLQEGKVQAMLRHPNVVSVTDLVDVDGALGLVMELVRGPSLAALVDDMRLSWDQIDDLARGMFDGIEAAHLLGLVHRDLKPANVLVELAPGRLIPKIADFGLVKLLDAEAPTRGQTRTGTTFGTPEYMAPEQISDAKGVDQRADVFSLGVMLFELVTGKKPFVADDLLELFNRLADGRRPSVRELVPDAPERMVRAIDAALVPDRTLRAKDVAAVRAAWTAGAPFAPPAPWSDAAIEQVRALARTERDPEALRRSFELGETSDTAIPPSMGGTSPSLPSQPASHASFGLPPAERSGSPIGLLALGVVWLLASVGLIGAGLVGLAVVLGTRTVDDAPTVVEAPAEPTDPAPVTDVAPEPPPEPVAPSPTPPAPPPPTPAPTPTRREPDAVAELPVEELVPEPVPSAPPPAPAPPPAHPPHVRVEGDVQVGFVPTGGPRAGQPTQADDLGVGPVDVIAWFEPLKPVLVENLNLQPGARWVVRCVSSRRRCILAQE